MWLIETSTLTLKFVPEPKRGSYAILSHTWGQEELSFEQFHNPEPTWSRAAGAAKVIETCQLASQHGLSYAWVDTCCINKASSAELSEAINSMFKYYQNSAFCIAFLSDLPPSSSDSSDPKADFERQFPHCRWLTRGWTLQELIAPPQIYFYDSTWTFRGSKNDWKSLLFRDTGVDETILDSPSGLRHVPVARRMSWVSNRQTTRTEDMAYCLLGIFDVNMALIYGEGSKAFLRLQEEIAKDSYDLSLFAWQQLDSTQKYRGILARSPAEFSNCRELKHRTKGAIIPTEFTLTNRGLRIETALIEIPFDSRDLILNLGFSYRDDWPVYKLGGWIGVYLTRTQNGFIRTRPNELFHAGRQERLRCPPALIYIRKMMDQMESLEAERRFERSIKVELPVASTVVTLDAALPQSLWIENRLSFLHQGRGINAYLRCSVHLADETVHPIIVACSTMGTPICTIWTPHDDSWSNIDHFLSNCNERADFIAADYLRAHFIRKLHLTAMSSVTKNIGSPGVGEPISISVKLDECVGEEGLHQFILRITHRVGGS
ncbi:heterokaryon incompatibility protein-domain-containing protein [Xylaria palmicola]|nr:heterokaryon incompatibility protein-domain-containing protein [Xylaria palmicola]